MSLCIDNQPSPSTKPSQKSVQFDMQLDIVYTYSATDYDRGGILPFPVLYKLNPSVLSPTQHRPVQKPKLSLAIPAAEDIYCDSEEDSASSTGSLSSVGSVDSFTSSPRRQLRPKLKVDTSICAGPLFFTDLSTNHVRHKVLAEEQDSNTNQNIYLSDYLVPMSAHV
ncbi:hypothetical protein J3Q64DRAFT_1760644 [Phycomyces blakesleeanus]|uniref:Uncharacterized protein n=2 Tax=Phycomyces blakesleeanus TaxID=4837 RepID=A0A162TPY7_PHYB8|nr:hypothetical protein PHYBLDRAFT_182985 [Phycomyces blakesleeanus NRRL 1555(-)]OAD68873.1 hypothetical protein PHYBLDRAFT_182985 [Phycomyces blakesleeanus NRRL 1555(-)]|eukprot:XP_018286913.1 hypothetical protein PHYBLDRAFT_182985 [Phycomyces blakesleeanus NRRL 1555(-)]